MTSTPFLHVKNLTASYKKGKTVFTAVKNVSLTLEQGNTVGLVGESGCGKTTLGRSILQFHKNDSGQVLLQGNDLSAMNTASLKRYRPLMQMIFQNPYRSLNPRMTVLDILSEPFRIKERISQKDCIQKVSELMLKTGLDPFMMRKFPHEFSGGQRQRIAIARALATDPLLIIADEPVSSLDVSVQAQILNLLREIHEKMNLSMIFISHDLSVVRYISDDIAVMYQGKIVEKGTCDQLFSNPLHPYTKMLLSAVPVADPSESFYAKVDIDNEFIPEETENGCLYSNRCPFIMDICKEAEPALETVDNNSNHECACHLINSGS